MQQLAMQRRDSFQSFRTIALLRDLQPEAAGYIQPRLRSDVADTQKQKARTKRAFSESVWLDLIQPGLLFS